MKKVLSVMLLAAVLAFSSGSVSAQAQADLDLNKDFNSELVPVSYLYNGRVVGISTYLSVREQPSANSREIMRIPNGSELYLRFYSRDWWQVLKINGNDYGVRPGDHIGYVSARYVQTY